MIYLILAVGFVKPGMNFNIPDYFNYSRKNAKVTQRMDVQAVKEQTAVKNDFLVNDDTTGYLGEDNFYTALDSAGNAYIAWEDWRNGFYGVWVIKKDASNNTIAGPVYVPENSSIDNGLRGIATDGVSKIGIVYDDNNYYYVRFFDLNLNPITGAMTIPDTTLWMYNINISMNKAGKTLISWRDNRTGSEKVYGQVFDELNAKVDTNIRLDNSPKDVYDPDAVISANGDIFVAWDESGTTTGYDIYYRLLDANLTEIASGKCNDDVGSAHQNIPYVSVNQGGYYVVIWKDYRNSQQDLYGQIYDSGGNAVGSNIDINGSTGTVHYYYDVSMANDSIFTAVWEDTTAGSSDPDIYMRRFDKSGSALTSGGKINSDIGYKQSRPHIGMSYDGSYLVVWEDYREGPEFGYGQRFTSGGSSVGENFVIDKNKGERFQFYPVSVYNPAGKYIIFWADERDEPDTMLHFYSRNYMQVFDETGTPVGENRDFTNQDYIYPLEPSAADNDSIIVYVWENYDRLTGADDVYFQRMDFTGTLIGTKVQVNKIPINSFYSFPDVSMDSTGAFFIVWMDANSNIKMQRYLSSGIGTGDTIVLNETSGTAFFPSCAETQAGDGLAVWDDNRGTSPQIYGQLIPPDSLLGNNFQISASSNEQDFPIVGASNTGFVVSWQEDRGEGWKIYAQRFGSDGSPLGGLITVTDDSIPFDVIDYNYEYWFLGYDYSLAVSPSGKFVFEWINTSADGNWDVYARAYNPDGTPMGGTFVVAEDIHPYDWQAFLERRSVSVSDNEILFTWSDTRRQKSWDIYGEVTNWTEAGIRDRKEITQSSPISVYPNPYTTRFSVKFSLNKKGKVDISIYDIVGKLVHKSVKTYTSGAHTVNMDISKIPQGVYFVRVNTGNSLFTRKIIHLR